MGRTFADLLEHLHPHTVQDTGDDQVTHDEDADTPEHPAFAVQRKHEIRAEAYPNVDTDPAHAQRVHATAGPVDPPRERGPLTVDDVLHALTKAQLRDMAAELGIDLAGVDDRKDDLVAALADDPRVAEAIAEANDDGTSTTAAAAAQQTTPPGAAH